MKKAGKKSPTVRLKPKMAKMLEKEAQLRKMSLEDLLDLKLHECLDILAKLKAPETSQGKKVAKKKPRSFKEIYLRSRE